MKRPVRAILIALILIGFIKNGFSDDYKRDIFILGVQLGGAECIASLFEGFPTTDKPGALDLIKRNLIWSIDTARRMGDAANALVQLQSKIDKLSFKEIHDQLLSAITSEQMTWASASTQISGLFILGVHLEGAECIASEVQSFERKDKPGSFDLIRRNVLWIQQEVRNVNLGLATNSVDDLLKAMDEGTSFKNILDRLAKIRTAWQEELQAQSAF